MRLKKFIKIGSFLTLLITSVFLTGSHAFAQAPGTQNDAASLSTSEGLAQEISPEVYRSAIFYIFLFLVFCIFLGIIGKVLKVYELTKEIQGKKGGINWNRIQSSIFGIVLIASLYGTYWTFDKWGYTALTTSGSVHGVGLDLMMMVTIIITTIVFIITHILLFGFAWKYPGTNKRKAYFYPHNNTIERLWTIVPAIVLTVLVVFGFVTWRSITNVPEDEQKKAINVEIVGEQFKWNVRYPGSDNKLGLRNYKLTSPTNFLGIDFKDRKSWDDQLAGEIVLPVNRPVRFQIGSKDILHSFFIPTMRAQINAVPGMTTYFQLTPRYTTTQMREKENDPAFDYVLLCNKICGSGHYNMKVKVTVVSVKEYEEWLVKQQLFLNDDIKSEFHLTQTKKEQGTNAVALNNK